MFLPFRRQVLAEEQRQLGLLGDHFVLVGRQLGSGFGAAVEVLDLDADGFDDLLVGAPFEYSSDSASGAVYVFFSNGAKQSREASAKVFRPPLVLRARSAHSQFGAALTRLGNLDNDPRGFQGSDLQKGVIPSSSIIPSLTPLDFAVGAPQSDDGQGSVFIFHGANWADFSASPVQEIHAKELKNSDKGGLRGFGGALAGGVDMDGNGYGELAGRKRRTNGTNGGVGAFIGHVQWGRRGRTRCVCSGLDPLWTFGWAMNFPKSTSKSTETVPVLPAPRVGQSLSLRPTVPFCAVPSFF